MQCQTIKFTLPSARVSGFATKPYEKYTNQKHSLNYPNQSMSLKPMARKTEARSESRSRIANKITSIEREREEDYTYMRVVPAPSLPLLGEAASSNA